MEDPNEEANDTTNFLLESKARLQRILQRLNWNFNTNSLASVPRDKKLLKQNATKESVFPPSCSTNNYCVLATPELQKLLRDDSLTAPKNFHELQANFTREQKLKIFEHVIQNTKKLENNAVDEVPAGEQSLADIVAENKREANRKKRKFRISKPTRIEEVRAMVGLQMQSLQQFVENQQKINSQKSISSFKDKQSHSKEESYSSERSKKAGNNRRQETSKEYNWHRPKETIERLKSTTEGSSKTHRYTDAFDFKTTDKKYYECTRKRSRTNSNSSRSKYKSRYRSRSQSPDARNRKSYRTTDREWKDYNSHSKKRSKSREYNGPQRERERTKGDKSYKTTEDKRSKDRHRERRSRSKEKHRHHKKKQKKSRSRSKTRDSHSRIANKREKNR